MSAALARVHAPAHAPGSVGNRLDAARRAVEGRFLQAGEVLAEAVDGLSRLIASLDQLRSALDSKTVDGTSAELAAAAAKLMDLPARHAGRLEAIEALSAAGGRLAGGIEEMRRNLAYLRVFAVNIKITAGGIAAAGKEFGDFAQEICDRIESGRGQLNAFDQDVRDLGDIFAAARAHEKALAEQCERLLPAVPDGLKASAQAMVAQHQRVAAVAVEVSGLAREVQKKMGQALAALQIGDITRQRIEHVGAALELLEAEAGLGIDQRERLARAVHGLLAAQLRATGEDFHRDVSRIGAAMDGIAGDAAEILRLRDLAFGRTKADDQGFLRHLEGHVGQALELVGDMARADRRAGELGGAAAAAAAHLAERIAGLQSIKTDVQQMALNTTLKCSRMGEIGKPLGVIAIELRIQAGHMETSSQAALTALEGVTGGAAALSGAEPEAGGLADDVGAVLSEVTGRLREAGDMVEADLESVARQGEAVVEGLRRAAGRLAFQREIGAVLDHAADALADRAGDEPVWIADLPLADLLTRIARNYTMAQERDAHAAFVATLDLDAPEPEPEAPAAQDDDVLF